jgi:SAM-dependent methyltransferase
MDDQKIGDWFKHWFDHDYAQLYAHRDESEARDAVATALRVAPALAQGPVLDLACGAGRHLSVLREVNRQAFGLDLSMDLLSLADASLRGHLLRADMRHLPIKRESLSGICLWFTPFGYFDDDQNAELLRELSDRIKFGGILLMDYLNATQLRASLVPEDVMERAGMRVHNRRSLEGDRVVKRMSITRLENGDTREATESVHIYEPDALISMAADAGLGFRCSLGTYQGSAFDEASPRWIGVFEKAKT